MASSYTFRIIVLVICNLSVRYTLVSLLPSDEASIAAVAARQAMLTSSKNKETTVNPLCSREQVRNGAWQHVTLDKPPYVPPINNKLICGPLEMYQQASFDSHKWRSHDATCEFAPWDKNRFCDLMRQESILFMGDSLTQEAAFAFGELLGLRTSPDDSDVHPPTYNFNEACNGTVRVIVRRDDFLRPSKVAWDLRENSPTVAVLNRGAHYVNDDILMQDLRETIQHVQEWQSNCAKAGRQCLLVWRTTVPGHPNCNSFPEPVTDRMAMEHLIATDPYVIALQLGQTKRPE